MTCSVGLQKTERGFSIGRSIISDQNGAGSLCSVKGGNFSLIEHPVGGESHILLLAGERPQSISCDSAHPNQTDKMLESSLEGSMHTMHVPGCPQGDTGTGRGGLFN